LAEGSFTASSPEEQIACGKGFSSLWEDALRKGWLIKHSDQRALPSENCKLRSNYSQAELKVLNYMEINATKCGIKSQVIDQLKAGYKKTEALVQRICTDAKQWPEGHPVISDFGDPAYERLGRELGR
jgi:hypothetical protein